MPFDTKKNPVLAEKQISSPKPQKPE
jgi:hypothetical protein